jgi:6-phosphofructokinase 1
LRNLTIEQGQSARQSTPKIDRETRLHFDTFAGQCEGRNMPGSKRIAILTSGGDAPGMNAAIRAATLVARAAGAQVWGIERGYRGLLDDAFVPLLANDVAMILRDGGTMLGSARCKEFHRRDVRDVARARLAARGIDGLMIIGGNGSLTGALHLADAQELGAQQLNVVGLPASIDNDLGLTGMSIGVDTALNTIVEAVDKISDTATAHDRTFIIEVMGRDCGYLAMTSAVATGADLALFPEAGRTETEIVDSIVHTVLATRARYEAEERSLAGASERTPSSWARPRRGKRVIIIKAEGVNIAIDKLKSAVDLALAEKTPAQNPTEIETRITVLGHVVRGGRPTAFDRLLGSRLANAAVRALLDGQSLKMAAWMPPVELPEDVAVRAPSDPYVWLVDLPAVLAETENLLRGRSALARWRAGVFDQIEDALLL